MNEGSRSGGDRGGGDRGRDPGSMDSAGSGGEFGGDYLFGLQRFDPNELEGQIFFPDQVNNG